MTRVSIPRRRGQRCYCRRRRLGDATPDTGEVRSKIIPFPAASRRAEIQKLAARMMNFSAERSESHLRHQIRIKAETMRRRGIAEDEIARQAKGFEWAVR